MTRNSEDFVGLGAGVPAMQRAGCLVLRDASFGVQLSAERSAMCFGSESVGEAADIQTRRREGVARYNAAFADISCLQTPQLRSAKDIDLISWHLYTVLIDFNALGRSRSNMTHQLREMGIATQVLYIPVYLQPYYQQAFGYRVGQCPQAEAFYLQALSLPLFQV